MGHAQRRHRLLPVPVARNRRGLIVQNHEYTDDGLLFPDGVANWNAEKTAQVPGRARRRRSSRWTRSCGGWKVRRPSHFARRITAYTPIDDRGPGRRSRAAADRGRPDRAPGCSARSTTARWASPRGAPTSPARRTSTGTSARPTERPARGPLRRSPRPASYLLVHDRHPLRPRRRAERGQPLRLGHRDRPVQARSRRR